MRRWVRTTLLIFAGFLAMCAVAAISASLVVRNRTEGQLRVALEEIGAPAGFVSAGGSTTGSVFCFGPCLRRHARYRSDMSFAQALIQTTAHMQSKGATRSCTLSTDCGKPLVPEDCRVVNDGPECLLATVVNGRPLFVSISRGAPPIEVRVTAAPKKDLNLLF